MLETHLRKRLEHQEILLMTHIVLGYPSFEDCYRIVEAMVAGGVDLMELQIPFSEPIADGPVILMANQQALAAGATVARCLEFADRVCREFPIPFLFMSYYNILFKFGVDAFAAAMADRGVRGAIVPDLPPEEGADYLAAMDRRELAPIFIYSPNTRPERLARIATVARGFVYCVARKGVTGADTRFSAHLEDYLRRCRAATALPLAVGFGVKDRSDVEFLTGKGDIAVIGTQTIRIIETQGIGAVTPFIRGLRP
ncbi:MAG: tryptophan synthase subunit alpha [Syntrophobacteraceae bacterium CG2_30_61_12]|nr:MAG: tryptophan synthase subunit alpha [Syntrophobacteraceae bacterium CG2_30_61_12]